MRHPHANLRRPRPIPTSNRFRTLTKIIVGIGLTQFPAIGRFFVGLGREWGPAFGAPPIGTIIAICITVHYLIMGFFQGFLLSSLWLPGAFERAQKIAAADASGAPEEPPATR